MSEEMKALQAENAKLRTLLQGWSDAVTGNSANRDNMLSINHDIIRGMVHVTRQALASTTDSGEGV